MFKNNKYMTRRISEKVPFTLQIWIWNAIEKLEIQQVDYLQVFQIKIKDKEKNIVEVTRTRLLQEL